jgi:hypothetical protein
VDSPVVATARESGAIGHCRSYLADGAGAHCGADRITPKEETMRRSRSAIDVVSVLTLAAIVVGVAGQSVIAAPAASAKKGVDADADRMLKQMTDYLAGLQSFTVQSSSVDQATTKSGEKIQATSDLDVAVQRPNRLRSTQRGAGDRLSLWYDGKTMTLACKESNTYETTEAAPTIDGTIDKMRKDFKIDAPGADLLYSKPYDILMEQVVSGRFVGRETIDGVAANHLAFRGEQVDFQLWIEDGARPVPLRFVITTKDVKGSPEFSVQLAKWDTKPKLSDAMFAFQAPAGAKPDKSVAKSCGVFQ